MLLLVDIFSREMILGKVLMLDPQLSAWDEDELIASFWWVLLIACLFLMTSY